MLLAFRSLTIRLGGDPVLAAIGIQTTFPVPSHDPYSYLQSPEVRTAATGKPIHNWRSAPNSAYPVLADGLARGLGRYRCSHR